MPNSILNTQPQVLVQGNSAFSPEMLKQLRQFKDTFRGNPKQKVMNMIRQGMYSNQQLQQAMNMAHQLQGFLH